ncbi:MAG: hypothetical protein HDS41_01430 [Bacteroides sp.]|nr:hypothetical protein [Bacteroides sp.]
MSRIIRLLFLLVVVASFCIEGVAQTTNIQVQVNNNSNGNSYDYTINGISKSKDIGGVDVTAQQDVIEFGFLSGGFAYNGTLPVVNGITLTNYNTRPVTVIIQLNYKTNLGRKSYPRFYDEGEKVLTVVIPGSKDPNPSKFIALPPSGSTFVTEIIGADMIVRPLQ